LQPPSSLLTNGALALVRGRSLNVSIAFIAPDQFPPAVGGLARINAIDAAASWWRPHRAADGQGVEARRSAIARLIPEYC